jgi:hypothetical protein
MIYIYIYIYIYDGKGNNNHTMRLSILFPSSAPWIIFGTSFQSSQHTGNVLPVLTHAGNVILLKNV